MLFGQHWIIDPVFVFEIFDWVYNEMLLSMLPMWSLVVLCCLSLCQSSMLPRTLPTHQTYILAKKSSTVALPIEPKPENSLQRLPRAIFSTISVSWQSLLSNSAIMIPLCLVVGAFHGHKKVQIWFQKSVVAGLEWGMISSVYTGAEEFLKILRNRDDVFNRSLASGLASGFFQFRTEGVKGFGMGFLSGFAFIYLFDQLMPSVGGDDKIATGPSRFVVK